MYHLPEHNKNILMRKIRHYKSVHFPGKGSGVRLASEMGVAPQTVSNWLNGKRQPTFSQLCHLSKIFGVSPLELCGIRRSGKMPRNATHIFVFIGLLKRYEELMKTHADPHRSRKFMEKLKDVIEKELKHDI